MFVLHARDQTAFWDHVVYAADKCNMPSMTRCVVSEGLKWSPSLAKVPFAASIPFLSSHLFALLARHGAVSCLDRKSKAPSRLKRIDVKQRA